MQLAFQQFEKERIKDFGGALLKGNPRDRRPISMKRPMHLVLRSSLARGEKSFLHGKRRSAISALVDKLARSKGVKIYRLANSGNHLHLLVLPRSRSGFNGFVRALSGLIARMVLGVERGRSKGLKFWDSRPFTRIVEWGRDFRNACAYVRQNTLEALGFVVYRPRSKKRSADGPVLAQSTPLPLDRKLRS
ncbi:MAG: transposase [Bdellovibrionales bacterium]|nr:transposase [Bdellovibrionales bacterium]